MPKKKKIGRPKGPKTVRMNTYVLPTTLKKIDAIVDREDPTRCSRGKIVDERFTK